MKVKIMWVTIPVCFVSLIAILPFFSPVPKLEIVVDNNVSYLTYEWLVVVEGYFERDESLPIKEDMYNHLFEKNIIYFIALSIVSMVSIITALYGILFHLGFIFYSRLRNKIIVQ